MSDGMLSVPGTLVGDVGDMADTADNLVHAALLPMPAEFHKEQLVSGLKEIRDTLRRCYVGMYGSNPWGEGES